MARYTNREKLIDMAEDMGIVDQVALDLIRRMTQSDVENFCESNQIELGCTCHDGARDTFLEMIDEGVITLGRNAWGGGVFVALVNWHTNDEIEEFCESEGYEI